MAKPELSWAKLLSIGERFFRTDIRYLVGGGSILFSGQVVSMLTAFLLALGYAHFLSKEAYGTYKYFLSILGILSIFALSGMEDAAKRAVAQGKDAALWDTWKMRVMGGIVGALAATMISLYYFYNDNNLLGLLFLISAPFLVFLEPLTHFNALLIGRRLFRHATMYSIFLQITVAAILFCVMFFTGNIFALVVAYLISGVLFRGLFFIISIKKFPTNDIPDPTAVPYGGHISAIGFTSTLSSRLDAILLFHFLGPVALATYSFARAISDNVQSSFKLLTTTLAFPKFAAQNKDVLKATLGRKILLAHAVTIPCALGIIAIVPFIYRYIFPQYVDSTVYAQVLIALLAFSPMRLYSTAITALAPAKLIYTTALSSAMLGSIFLLVFVPLYGIWGVIIALATQQAIVNALNVYLFRKM